MGCCGSSASPATSANENAATKEPATHDEDAPPTYEEAQAEDDGIWNVLIVCLILVLSAIYNKLHSSILRIPNAILSFYLSNRIDLILCRLTNIMLINNQISKQQKQCNVCAISKLLWYLMKHNFVFSLFLHIICVNVYIHNTRQMVASK